MNSRSAISRFSKPAPTKLNSPAAQRTRTQRRHRQPTPNCPASQGPRPRSYDSPRPTNGRTCVYRTDATAIDPVRVSAHTSLNRLDSPTARVPAKSVSWAPSSGARNAITDRDRLRDGRQDYAVRGLGRDVARVPAAPPGYGAGVIECPRPALPGHREPVIRRAVRSRWPFATCRLRAARESRCGSRRTRAVDRRQTSHATLP